MKNFLLILSSAMTFPHKHRLPQPEKILPYDTVQIIAEEEKYESLIGKTFVIGTVKKESEDGRMYGLCFFNGKAVAIYPDGEKAVEIYTKRQFLELEKRTVDKEVFYYQRLYLDPKLSPEEERTSLLRWVVNLVKAIVIGIFS